MKPQPTATAWAADPFWTEVVDVLTGGKKLRPEHYLNGLDAAELEALRLALSSAGSFAEQQKLCPPRRGGRTDGSLPPITLLCEISQAMRQVNVLRELESRQLVEAAAKRRCGELGLNSQLTNAVVQIVGEEALKQKAEGVVDGFTLKAANVLMKREGQQFEQEKFKESLRTKLETALAALAEHIKGNAPARAAYEAFKATLAETTK